MASCQGATVRSELDSPETKLSRIDPVPEIQDDRDGYVTCILLDGSSRLICHLVLVTSEGRL